MGFLRANSYKYNIQYYIIINPLRRDIVLSTVCPNPSGNSFRLRTIYHEFLDFQNINDPIVPDFT